MSEEEPVIEEEQEELESQEEEKEEPVEETIQEETKKNEEIEVPMPLVLETLRSFLRLLPIFIALLTGAVSLLNRATITTTGIRVAGALFITMIVSVVLMYLSTHLVLWLMRTAPPAPIHTQNWEA